MKFSPAAIYHWYRNTLRNPQYRLWVILGTLIYLVSPLDISPDVFPIAGQLDDVIIVTLLMSEVSQMVFEHFQNKKIKTTATTSETSTETIDVDAVSVK
jgi:uncharacterized membrane protein YkvA (DUF1232 family)